MVVVDMVRFFAADSAYVRAVVPTIAATAQGFRRAGAAVAWVLPAVVAPSPWALGFYGEQISLRYAESGGTGPPHERLADGLGFANGDLVAEKSAASAFFPGRCDLPESLRARGVDRVVIAGTVTSAPVNGQQNEPLWLVLLTAHGEIRRQASAASAAS